jgi:hypothetical protein
MTQALKMLQAAWLTMEIAATHSAVCHNELKRIHWMPGDEPGIQ